MAGIVSKNSVDLESVMVVPVITSFSAQGRIKPLYVRIHGKAFKIDTSYEICNFINTIDFSCKVIDGNSTRPIKLTFHRNEGMWTVQTY